MSDTKNSDPKIIIAIDGYSSCGKSTMAKQLAARIGYVYVDSGAMYRAVTLYALDHGMIRPDGTVDVEKLTPALPDIRIEFEVNPETGASETLLNGINVEREIRSLRISSHVSPIAAVGAVREVLTRLQQHLGEKKGIVMDGRDIGTTVFPHAELKIFVEATPEVRARRRYKELIDKGMPADYDDVYRNICERDEIDRTRKVSPLRRAKDAILLDNSHLCREEQLEMLLDYYRAAIAKVRGNVC